MQKINTSNKDYELTSFGYCWACSGCKSAPACSKVMGFTLIELLVVVAIIGILSSIALPSFFQSIIKSRRSDAFVALGGAQQAQEKYRLSNTTYAASATLLGISSNSDGGYYTISVSGNTGTDYVLTATAVASKSQNSDAGCTEITISKSGANTLNAPAACWSR